MLQHHSWVKVVLWDMWLLITYTDHNLYGWSVQALLEFEVPLWSMSLDSSSSQLLLSLAGSLLKLPHRRGTLEQHSSQFIWVFWVSAWFFFIFNLVLDRCIFDWMFVLFLTNCLSNYFRRFFSQSFSLYCFFMFVEVFIVNIILQLTNIA